MNTPSRLACRRCRVRKQRAQATCVPSQRSSRKSSVNPEYARALEERIQELEARQGSDPVIETIHSSPPAPFPRTPSLGILPSLPLPSPDASSGGDVPDIPPHTQDHLVQIFLQRVNPRYPFLHEETFVAWYGAWKASRAEGVPLPAGDRWKAFFVKMAFAVSLLIAPRVSPDDMKTSQVGARFETRWNPGSRSQALYASSLSSLDTVFACLDPVRHAQAYLLCTLHALHSPSSQTVLTMISAAMRCCVIAQLHRAMPERTACSLLEMQIRRRVFWSAYAIDRLVSWVYHVPCSLVDDDIQVEPFANMNDEELTAWTTRSDRFEPDASTPRRTQVSSALHLIRGRRIQSRILRVMMRADYDQRFAGCHAWRLHMVEVLDQWKAQLQPHSDPRSAGYTSEGWVGMLYNYTILLLYRPTQANMCDLVAHRCLQACTDIVLTFWGYLKSRQTAQLWPGLLSQFGIGITLLYCLWVTPPSHRSTAFPPLKVGTAIRTCSVILAVLSERWTPAEPLRDMFDHLADAIPVHSPPSDRPQHRRPIGDGDPILSQMPRIHAIVVNKDILRMLTEMITEECPWETDRVTHLSGWSEDDRHDPSECSLCWGHPSAVGNLPSEALLSGDLWPAFDPSPGSQSWTMAGGESPFFPGLLGSIEF
ncbi:hypothetical protein BO70DRAFT_385409 [Aspergillus heteromorphus CBS 117.55]|uniref:Xylanolytic transcriptional activator regulatory domain-containing protein n=1 Tax=Aspergillus heteromorphus CBS 117.55 TaxID=1448321 RepID=A0A317WNU5_9EURO|nr:uncharacterized protein BO70DRAFT_385409 [Aspergillus heteromorphus CBS 117.55]PWY88144.1 hypothetical protein BO70DRAFT_385409 [Aspergillus heteromorphus CBS 117.55]